MVAAVDKVTGSSNSYLAGAASLFKQAKGGLSRRSSEVRQIWLFH